MGRIRRALISVYDKRGIIELARALSKQGVEIISTGGTAQALRQAGIRIIDVSVRTGFPELLDGRVKTLHPKIHAAILADRKNKKHMDELKKRGIEPIDLVVVNLYPFEDAIGHKHTLHDAIENMDIGGPTLLRAAAKNFESVAVVCNPAQYPVIIRELEPHGQLSDATRRKGMCEALEHVAHYDAIIADYFRNALGSAADFPAYLTLPLTQLRTLRYGENHHQKAAVYLQPGAPASSLVRARVLKEGKYLSYNNLLDGNAALELIKEFRDPTAVVIKHSNPSGVASSPDILEAYKTARSVDPEAAFGGIVAVNRKVDERLAREILSTFVEVVVAPSYTREAKRVFEERKNLRVLEIPRFPGRRSPYREYRSIVGGVLVQDADVVLSQREPRVVTRRKPTEKEQAAMEYAWKIAKYVKSNAIVFAKENRAVGIGAGQMKRVDAAKLAAMIARDYSGPESLQGCAMASDAFFPFRDGIDFAAKLGITAIIQPGGSIKDAEVIAAANEHNLTMLFTGTRHFKH